MGCAFLTCSPSDFDTAGPWATLKYLILLTVLWTSRKKRIMFFILLYHSQKLMQHLYRVSTQLNFS